MVLALAQRTGRNSFPETYDPVACQPPAEKQWRVLKGRGQRRLVRPARLQYHQGLLGSAQTGETKHSGEATGHGDDDHCPGWRSMWPAKFLRSMGVSHPLLTSLLIHIHPLFAHQTILPQAATAHGISMLEAAVIAAAGGHCSGRRATVTLHA